MRVTETMCDPFIQNNLQNYPHLCASSNTLHTFADLSKYVNDCRCFKNQILALFDEAAKLYKASDPHDFTTYESETAI